MLWGNTEKYQRSLTGQYIATHIVSAKVAHRFKTFIQPYFTLDMYLKTWDSCECVEEYTQCVIGTGAAYITVVRQNVTLSDNDIFPFPIFYLNFSSENRELLIKFFCICILYTLKKCFLGIGLGQTRNF